MYADVVYGRCMLKSLSLALVAFVVVSGACTSKSAGLTALADDSACEVDSDCCAATDGCAATSYAVDRSQAAAAAEVIAGADAACVDCIAPSVVPSCRQARCVLTEIDFDAEGPATEAVGAGVQCLQADVEVAPAVDDTRAVGCGVADDE